MSRKPAFRTIHNESRVRILVDDPVTCPKLVEYGRRKNMNMSQVVHKLIIESKSIDDLLDELDREKYELLDEDQKIEVILDLERKLKEAQKDVK